MLSFGAKKVVSSTPTTAKPKPAPWTGLLGYAAKPAKKTAPKKGGARTRRLPMAVTDMAELRIVNGVPVLNRRLHAVTNSSGRTRVTECNNGRRKNYTMGTRRKSNRKSKSRRRRR
jgi:hypothetical protein